MKQHIFPVLVILLSLLALGQGAALWMAHGSKTPLVSAKAHCLTVPYRLDEGGPLRPAFGDGASLEFLEGESCPVLDKVKRNSVVSVRAASSLTPVARFVKALPGDEIALERRAGRISVLTVNGQDVMNSAGEPYSVVRGEKTRLERTIAQFGGVVPLNGYLLLGDAVQGALDAPTLGFTHGSNITGILQDNPYEGES